MLLSSRSEECTPLGKVRNLLERDRKDPSRKNKQKCILISTGSYNPVHTMHVRTFYLARKALEENHNVSIVGAFLSPSHGDYVQSKLGESDYIDTEHRLRMVELSIEEEASQRGLSVLDQFLSLDKWESTVCTGFADFPEVTVSLRDYITQQFPKENIRIMYLCGTDHFCRCGYLRGLRRQKNIGVVTLKRPSHKGLSDEEMSKSFPDVFIVETNMEEECSSTLIRKQAQAGESISKYVHPSVESYMKTNKIYYV